MNGRFHACGARAAVQLVFATVIAGVLHAQPVPDLAADFRHAPSDAGILLLRVVERGQETAQSLAPPQLARDTAPDMPVPPGLDRLVNNPALDRGDGTTQSEPTLAVLGSTICAGYNNTRRGPLPAPLSGLARSTDRGATWTDLGTTGRLRFSDPVLAVHRATETIYYADIALEMLTPIIGVSKSTDGCASFPRLVNASPSARGEQLQDKPWIAVDNSGGPFDGHVYVCWTRFGGDGSLHFSRSTDGGDSFADEQVIAPPTDVSPFGCDVEVGPSGEIYVAWSDRGEDFPIRFRKSLDGGLTWEAPVQVNAMPIRHPGIDRTMFCDGVRATLNGDIRILPQAWMAVDTTGGLHDGTIYLLWANDPPGQADNSDLFFSRSTDAGITWSPEVQMAGGTATDQFLPNLAVGGAGVLSLVWYDRRNDPVNNLSMDVYATLSRDGGETFSPLLRVSDVGFGVPPINGQATASGNFDPGRSACYMGDYIAVAGDDDYFYYAWGDNRRTVVSDAYPNGRLDPDVVFERRLLACGDGTTDPTDQCDDDNFVDGDGCDSNCTRTSCGNGVRTDGERCDDGNRTAGDGCDANCVVGPTFTPTPTVSPTPTLPPPCAVDCDRNGAVTIDELVLAVNIALGNGETTACANADVNGDGAVTVDEIIRGVNAVLAECA